MASTPRTADRRPAGPVRASRPAADNQSLEWSAAPDNRRIAASRAGAGTPATAA